MTIAICAVLAVIVAIGFYMAWTGINTPEGAHHRPPKPSLRQRLHERGQRAQAERAREDAWLAEAQAMVAEQYVSTGPLMPLPPEAQPEVCDECGKSWDDCDCDWFEADAEPVDPLDVATSDDQADELVGGVGASGPTSNAEAASVDPAPLFDTSADHWNDDTLLGLPAVKA